METFLRALRSLRSSALLAFGGLGGAAALYGVHHLEHEAEAAAGQQVGAGAVELVTESCSHTYTAGAETLTYAEHPFPGVTMRFLASVKAVGHLANHQQSAPPGYEYMLTTDPAYVRPGAVAVVCGNKAAARYDSVTFIVPQ